jgi:integrase
MARKRRRGQNPRPYEEKGRWKFKYRRDVAQADGRVVRKQCTKVLGSVDSTTYTEACRAAREFVRPFDDLEPGIEYTDRTMAQLIAMWRESIKPTLKRSTQESYEWGFGKWIVPAFGSQKVSEIERHAVQKFLTIAGQTLAPESVHDLRARLRGVLSVAVEWGWTPVNPAAGRLRLPRKRRIRDKLVLTPANLQALVMLLAQPYSVIVTLAVLSGLRKGEIEALRWKDIHDGFVTVDEAAYRGTLDSPKTPKSNRTVSIGPVVQQAIKDWRKAAKFTGPDDFVFAIRKNAPVDLRHAVARHVKPACRRLGLSNTSFHSLRHTYTTWGRRAGVAAEAMRDQLGHSSVLMTLDVYSHVDERDSIAKAIEKYASGGLLLPQGVTPDEKAYH